MTHTSDGTPHPLTLKKNQALRKDPEVGRVLDLGTVVSPDVDSRDSFEKVFQKLELFEELAQRGRTSEEGPACGGARRVRTAAGALNNPQYVRRWVEAATLEAAATAEARADAAHPDKAAAREARQLLERSLADAPAGVTKYFNSVNTWW